MGWFKEAIESLKMHDSDNVISKMGFSNHGNANRFYNNRDYNGIYTFVDVETPNTRNDRICSIGIIRTDSFGNPLYANNWLVNPETYFEQTNVDLHGITPIDVSNAPNFYQLYNQTLIHMFRNALLVAHNADFDLTVISKTLESYGVYGFIPKYACTLKMARKANLPTKNNKLPTLCSYIGYDLENHHNSLADVSGCCRVFWYMKHRLGVLPEHFDFNTTKESIRHFANTFSYCEKTQTFRELLLILKAASSDKVITIDEAQFILQWLSQHPTTEKDKSIIPIKHDLELAVKDGVIDADEQKSLLRQFRHLLDPFEPRPKKVILYDKNFVLSGVFKNGGNKDHAANFIIANGGTVYETVSRKIDYVVVGDVDCDEYAMGNYGTKVKRALEIQGENYPIRVIKEEDLFSKSKRQFRKILCQSIFSPKP